jgi:2-aminoadipate transaminase
VLGASGADGGRVRHNPRVAVEPTLRSWEALFAERTRGGAGEGLIQILAVAAAKDVISFAGGFPDPVTFPCEEVARILRELAERGDASPFQYSPTAGLPGPREYVADRLERLEGHRPEDGELMLTSGAVEAMELVGKAFLDRGDRVLVEAPTYLGAIMAFQGFEAVVEGVPLDEEGLAVDELERRLASGPAPKLLYTIPDYQNPAGVSLSAERREALVELARRHGLLVLEDVAYRELAFTDERPPSLWSLAPEIVVQAGTFSKTFFPGVRLGWAAGPAEVVAKLVWAKQNTDQCAGALGQRLLEEYGRRGHLDEGLVRARALYRSRRDAIMGALERHLGDGAAWTRPEGGFFTWVELPSGADAVATAGRALEARVAVVPGPPFFPAGGGERHIRLSFSRADEAEIDEGIGRLAPLLATPS